MKSCEARESRDRRAAHNRLAGSPLHARTGNPLCMHTGTRSLPGPLFRARTRRSHGTTWHGMMWHDVACRERLAHLLGQEEDALHIAHVLDLLKNRLNRTAKTWIDTGNGESAVDTSLVSLTWQMSGLDMDWRGREHVQPSRAGGAPGLG
jgi:hypothetical protein